ncbi:Hypothetical predicted protein, partial [Mytilus galloprovincialis]
METDGGGWTVFQRRQDGKVDFYRGWEDYVNGFGHFNTEFWLGNDKLYKLTSRGQYELRVNLEDFNGDKAYAKYSNFYIGDKSTNYKLTVNGYSGTAGDSLKRHNDHAFTTKDKDNDTHSSVNCAKNYKGAWWYYTCHASNLNGLCLCLKLLNKTKNKCNVCCFKQYRYFARPYAFNFKRSKLWVFKPAECPQGHQM